MLSKIERAIYNVYICYAPIVIITLIISIKLLYLAPTRCLFDSLARECLVYKLDLNLVYHPLNLLNLIFTGYNILYLYYNIILKQDVVGKTVQRIYSKTKIKYNLKKQQEQLKILLFCYIMALILSYFRFLVTLRKIF